MKKITYLIFIILLISCGTKKEAINKSQTQENIVILEQSKPKEIQKYDFDLITTQFTKQLIAKDYSRYKFLNDNSTYYEKTEDKIVGTLNVEFYENSFSDFNKDSISDIWVKITNKQITANNYSSHQLGILQISNNKSLKFIEYFHSGDDYSIKYDIIGLKNKNPLIKINKNTNKIDDFNFIEDKVIELGFDSKTRKLSSLSYPKDCEMSKMKNKNLFLDIFERTKKKDTSVVFERGGFTENKADKIEIEGNSYFGQINGCNNLNIWVQSILKYNHQPKKEQVIKDFLDSMIDATCFETTFEKIKTHYYSIGLTMKNKETNTSEGWQYYIEIDRFPKDRYDKVYLWYNENNYRKSK